MQKSIMRMSLLAVLTLAVARLSTLNVYADLAPVPEKKFPTIWVVLLVVVIVAVAVYFYMNSKKKQ